MFGLRNHVRAWLGTDTLPRMESTMTTFLTLLQGLTDQTTAASASQQASFLNLHNAVDKLTQSVKDLQDAVTNGDVSPEVEAAAAAISADLDTMKKAADTADDGFEPVEVPPVDVPPTDTPDEPAPVDPTVPVEDVPADEPAQNAQAKRR